MGGSLSSTVFVADGLRLASRSLLFPRVALNSSSSEGEKYPAFVVLFFSSLRLSFRRFVEPFLIFPFCLTFVFLCGEGISNSGTLTHCCVSLRFLLLNSFFLLKTKSLCILLVLEMFFFAWRSLIPLSLCLHRKCLLSISAAKALVFQQDNSASVSAIVSLRSSALK